MSEACIEPLLQEQDLGAEPLVGEIFGALHYCVHPNHIVVMACKTPEGDIPIFI